MTDIPLKLVLSLDSQSQSYAPVAHNLSAQEAVEHVERLQADSIMTTIVAQEQSHCAVDIRKCKQCKKAAEAFAKQLNHAGPNEDQNEQDRASVGDGGETDQA
jgi:predicted secreted Zn-dependent protease